MDFNNKYNRILKTPKEDFSEVISHVDLVGYIPKERQIKMLIEAGKRLVSNRGIYDFQANEKVDIDEIDPDVTRNLSFDLADASEIMKKYQIVTVNFETGEYLDKTGYIRNIKDGKKVYDKPVPDTSSRSVSGQMTPKGEIDSAGSAEEKVLDEQSLEKVTKNLNKRGDK